MVLPLLKSQIYTVEVLIIQIKLSIIDLVNEQNSDLMLFTGDIVNTDAKECNPWIEAFNGIKNTNMESFVLGTMIMGSVTWPSEAAKENNFKAIKDLYGQIGLS
jgi:hypothetical protein